MLTGARPARAQTTAYVAVLDPAYQDLEALVSAGLVQDLMFGERPYSRAAFRRFVEEATRRSAGQEESPRIQEALDRLERRFGASDEGRFVRAAPARIDLAVTNSPYRPYRRGSLGDTLIGTLNPLLQSNQGRILEDGLTAAIEGGITVQSTHLAGEVIPRVYLGVPSGSGSTHLTEQTVDAYARTVIGPVAVDLGRNSVTWGYGAEGGGLLSDNPRGMDQIRLAEDRPVRLPGGLGKLGLWQASIAAADMGADRYVPQAVQTMMRLSYRPIQYVELGVNYTNLQGGKGTPRADFLSRLHDIFFPFFLGRNGIPKNEISDKVAGFDLRLSAPKAYTSVYVNFFTTDDRGLFQQRAKGYWNDALWSAGLRVTDLGTDGRMGMRLEWSRSGPRAFTHWQFKSGQTLDGRVLGDAIGPNAASVSGAIDWTGPSSRLTLTGTWERYSGDDYYWKMITDAGGGVDYQWFKAADNPDEIRERVVADYLKFDGWRHFETSLRVGLEHVTRFDFTEAGRTDALAQVSVGYRW
jgi:hypothetical protein